MKILLSSFLEIIRLILILIQKGGPGRKGTSSELIRFIIETKIKIPRYGCPKIVLLISNVLGISISEETVRKILKNHYRPLPGDGPSWLAKVGNSKNKLWSIDFFRIESVFLESLRVMVVMDQFSRGIIGIEICRGSLSGPKI